MTEVFAENEGIHFEYGPNEKYYGFEEDIFGGCQEWCSVSDYEYKASASSTLKSQLGITYDASNVLNYERKNTWVEGVNGYAENIEKQTNNSRVKELKFFFNDEYISNIELEDTINPQYINIEEFGLKAKFGEEVKFKFEIVDVYEGQKYDDTAITGIVVDFWTKNHQINLCFFLGIQVFMNKYIFISNLM